MANITWVQNVDQATSIGAAVPDATGVVVDIDIPESAVEEGVSHRELDDKIPLNDLGRRAVAVGESAAAKKRGFSIY